ncbi:hypothetical protein GCM10027610_126040 [Dactylosporangium cerinum]
MENPHPMFTTHTDTLERALTAIAERAYWSAYPESPSPRVYGEHAAADGEAAFRAYLGADFPLKDQPSITDWVATESSPFGIPLDVRYPHLDVDDLLAAAAAGLPAWRDAGPQTRAGVCVEILARLHSRAFELANAVHATTGQAFVMAFQAGAPHAFDRALEAIAYAYREMIRTPATATWEKPAGKGEPLRMSKTFHIVPRGVALVIGCNTFPTWNSFPGLFASLATGNPVVVKPHPGAVLPLAITVRIAREVLADAGFDPNLVLLAPEAPGRASPRPSRCAPRCASSTSPARPSSATGWRTTPARPSCTPRRPASTRSSSTRPAISPGCAATSASRCCCIPARCARRHRTSWCPRAASTPRTVIARSTTSPPGSPPRSPH